MILTGKPLSAVKAKKLGIIDVVVKDVSELLPAAVALAEREVRLCA